MLVRLLEDLRFVIGLFFSIIGALLVVMGLVDPPAEAMNLNLGAGAVMVVFSVIMFTMTYFGENPEDYKPGPDAT